MKGKLKYIAICLFLFAVSCKSSKETASTALSSMTGQERINSIIQSGIQYNDLSSNLKLTVRPGQLHKETSLDAQLRIVKDEALQISLRIPVLGSEAFRIVITPEKMLIIDRLNRQYLSETMQDIQKQIPFDLNYYNLEALFTNQLFIAGKKEISPADYAGFQIREDPFRANISYLDNRKILYNFESDYTHHIQTTRMEQKNSSSYMQCNYTDWKLISDNRMFPMTLRLQLHTPNETYNLNCSYKSMLINTAFAIDYNIPNKYRQVTLQEVARLIEQLL